MDFKQVVASWVAGNFEEISLAGVSVVDFEQLNVRWEVGKYLLIVNNQNID